MSSSNASPNSDATASQTEEWDSPTPSEIEKLNKTLNLLWTKTRASSAEDGADIASTMGDRIVRNSQEVDIEVIRREDEKSGDQKK